MPTTPADFSFDALAGARGDEPVRPIRAALRPFPRAGLVVAPSPIAALPRLSSRLGRAVYVLREDLTGYALGGNKTRKLDYLIGDALAKHAEVLIAREACSFTRNAAAAAKLVGMELHVVLSGAEADHNLASREYFELFEATLHHDADYETVLAALRADGRTVYELCPGGSNEIGSLGYLQVFDEIADYSARTGVHFDKMIVPTGSTATQVGLLLGQLITGYTTDVIGIAISQPEDVQRQRVRSLAVSTASMLGATYDDAVLHVDDRFLGAGYAHPTPGGRDAVRAFAHLEGVILDQVYGGKAAAGLLHMAAHGELAEGETALFIHTGGNFGLYY